MNKYHISKTTGRPNKCTATKRACPIGGDEEHFDSKEQAVAALEERAKKENDSFSTFKKTSQKPLEEKYYNGFTPNELKAFGKIKSSKVEGTPGGVTVAISNGKQQMLLSFHGDCCSSTTFTIPPNIPKDASITSFAVKENPSKKLIAEAEMKAESGEAILHDYYTMKFSDGSKSDFVVTNYSNGYYSTISSFSVRNL